MTVLRVHDEDLLDELLLIESDGFAVAAFAAVGGIGAGRVCRRRRRAAVPVVRLVAAGGVVADDDDGDVGFAGGLEGVVFAAGRVISGVVDLDVGADLRS